MNIPLKAIFFLSYCLLPAYSFSQRVMENLDRGVIVIRTNDNKVYIGWRLFATDADNLAFNVYRKTGTGTTQLNKKPIVSSTNFIDDHPDLALPNSYFIKPVLNGKESQQSKAFTLLVLHYPLRKTISRQ